ncbi:Ebp2-domain-containing protein [Gymnopus androsaceus JB14]|uniref:Ebp2-domain-containing protein n=1 Tax=Gymnopus androsaceus JB14 TaxID=1447944 RepID=A0A6A4HVD3_9AGAR|nr:Ebp2-domain-containing protein [Gymnopus androsaceus JB14]
MPTTNSSKSKSKPASGSALKKTATATASSPPASVKTKTKAPKAKAAAPVEEEEGDKVDDEIADSNDGEEEDLDSDDGGVDEEGMERLMKALGDDGLDEFEQAQLQAALGEEEDSDDEENDNERRRNEEEEDEEEDSQYIQLEDVEEDIDDADAVPIQKVEINNEVALARIRESMQLDPSIPWTETLAVSYPHTIDADVNDDLNRELAFYKQALHSASHAKSLAAKSYPNFPWTRPNDYFAEMVKTDVHMERIRQRLLDEKAGIKKSEDKRKEREGKKFGKEVQMEKLRDRERGKKEMEERLKGLKRSKISFSLTSDVYSRTLRFPERKDILENPNADDDAFDVAVEDAISDRPAKRGRGGPAGGSRISRQGRDKKFGFGGAGRRSKQNTRDSTDNFDFGSGKGAGGRGRGSGRGGRGGSRGGGGGRGDSKRLGKSRRMDARSK